MAKLISNIIGKTKALIISSTAVRAFITAKAFAKELGISTKDINTSPDLYHASEEEILEAIQLIDDDFDTAMIFGHNPEFTYFANEVSNADISNIPTSGVVCVAFDVDSWSKVRFHKGVLKFFEYPKKYFDK